MATKLNTITGHYHSYTEDQVLTHYQLNETIDYFDDQNRLQNVYLIGTGIACGFVVNTNAAYDAITITQGTGITTDGDVIKLKKELKNEIAESVKQKLFTLDFESITYKTFKAFTADKGKYNHFLDSSDALLPMWELLPEKAAGTELETGESALSTFTNLKNHVVLLYLENYSKEPSLCSTIDCSNQGGEEVFTTRVLLVSKATADLIISKDALYQKFDYFETYKSLPELGIKKVVPTYSNTSTATKIKQLFNTVVTDTTFKDSLKNSITKILTSLNYSNQATIIETGIDDLFKIVDPSIPSDIHYKYDALKDIVDTYKELKDIYIQLRAECNPPIGSFPKHLFLGVVEDLNYHKAYRHLFYKSPILDNQNKTFKNFDSLINRLISIVSKYTISANTIKITPSKVSGKLGHKSIPYYYEVDVPFLYSWDFEKSALFMHQANFSYHTSDLLNNDFIKSPTKYTLDDYDFYRIEGYLNNDIEEVRTYLNTQKRLFGLDFDFQILDIVDDVIDLKYILNNNVSFQHKSGVKKGGTLLLLKEGESFIADFAVDYKIAVESGLGCCTIIECLYPWISSLRYINNLSRSLRGTPSERIDLPTHYRLKILKYSINGINLINSAVIISISLDQILARRLHVVMEKLNTEFPTGLLFDFIEEEKKVKISKLEQDKFEFEVQDVTLDRKSPVYKYTETGVVKNDKVYSNLGITCSQLNTHHSDVYKKLHNLYDPINKDDDNFGRFKEDWDKWEFLRGKLRYHQKTYEYIRFAKYFDDFWSIPVLEDVGVVTVADDLLEIANAITNADERFNAIYIGGDWTDGNWVNPTMLDYYNENMYNTDDYLVLFINLRKKLHNESNVSKYMIHIDNKKGYNTNNLNSVITTYANKADFYFEKPANGGHFIRIGQFDNNRKSKTIVKEIKTPRSTIKKPKKPAQKPTPRIRRPRNGDIK